MASNNTPALLQKYPSAILTEHALQHHIDDSLLANFWLSDPHQKNTASSSGLCMQECLQDEVVTLQLASVSCQLARPDQQRPDAGGPPSQRGSGVFVSCTICRVLGPDGHLLQCCTYRQVNASAHHK